MSWQILEGDVRERLRDLADESIQSCVTSPPYWGLRDYGTADWQGGDPACEHVGEFMRTAPAGTEKQASNHGTVAVSSGDCRCGAQRVDAQLGLEPTPELYVEHMVEVFREVRRVLRRDGTLWLNLGDSYNSAPAGANPGGFQGAAMARDGDYDQAQSRSRIKGRHLAGLKPKDLVGIPWMVAFALRADGWYLRADVIWAKPNPMPESVRDRPTKAHEYLFLLTKSPRYYYDQDAIRDEPTGDARPWGSIVNNGADGSRDHQGFEPDGLKGRNKPSVWTVSTRPYSEAHFATYPPALIEPCILAGAPEKACAECGAPWQRQVEIDRIPTQATNGITPGRAESLAREHGERSRLEVRTIGWEPGCTCHYAEGLEPDDFEIIETPTGERAGEDPSLQTGRAGLNRPRGADEGRRPITRYEQRRYAEQLHAAPARPQMEAAAGPAFAHYTRTDRAGARPVPAELLEAWIEAGWIQRVEPPATPPLPQDTAVPQILDPFAGSGTTGVVALRLNRAFVGVELNPAYAEMARYRIRDDAPLLNTGIEVLEEQELEAA